MNRLVVVGYGRAGDAFLRQIRGYKCDLAITVFGDGTPPQKPAWYQAREIDLRQGVRITAVDRHARLVTGSDGSRTTYSRLILAIGASELRLPGLLAGRGLVVNQFFETSDGYIYAVGACAEIRDARWAATLEKQARILASHLAADAIGMELAEKKGGRTLFLVPRSEPNEADEVRIA
jgi:NAD(P)H-nitrite reductase large subunit